MATVSHGPWWSLSPDVPGWPAGPEIRSSLSDFHRVLCKFSTESERNGKTAKIRPEPKTRRTILSLETASIYPCLSSVSCFRVFGLLKKPNSGKFQYIRNGFLQLATVDSHDTVVVSFPPLAHPQASAQYMGLYLVCVYEHGRNYWYSPVFFADTS